LKDSSKALVFSKEELDLTTDEAIGWLMED